MVDSEWITVNPELMLMFNRSEILRTAWANYRRDVFKGWGVARGEAFNRKHFGYCLRMAWAIAKDVAATAVAAAERAHEAAAEAVFASLKGVGSDAKMQVATAKAQRAEAIRAELLDLELGDFVPWAQHTALTTELAGLA